MRGGRGLEFYYGDRILEVVATLFSGKANDVVVCRDISSPVDAKYTMLVVHDHDCVKKLLPILESCQDELPYTFSFAQNNNMIYGFPFRAERRFSSFAKGQMQDPKVGESICISLVMECISSPFPPELLYLILTQDSIQLTKENEIYFTPVLDLSLLDTEIRERECTICCAKIILELLEGAAGKKKLKSFELIRKKIKSNSYSIFTELFRDIKLTAMPGKKLSIKQQIKGWWLRSKDSLFRILLILCILAVIVAIIMLISQLIYGDIPLLRLFKHCFDVIGTENLT